MYGILHLVVGRKLIAYYERLTIIMIGYNANI
jgi:hypothetical protein